MQIAPLLGAEAQADPYLALEGAVNLFLAGQISASTRSTLERQSADPQIVQIKSGAAAQVNLGTITGLVLGAPEFQQR